MNHKDRINAEAPRILDTYLTAILTGPANYIAQNTTRAELARIVDMDVNQLGSLFTALVCVIASDETQTILAMLTEQTLKLQALEQLPEPIRAVILERLEAAANRQAESAAYGYAGQSRGSYPRE